MVHDSWIREASNWQILEEDDKILRQNQRREDSSPEMWMVLSSKPERKRNGIE